MASGPRGESNEAVSVSLCAEQHLFGEVVVGTLYSSRSQFAFLLKHPPSFEGSK